MHLDVYRHRALYGGTRMRRLLVYLSHDEATDKFSTSKFLVMVSFYFILFLNGRALYLDREVKTSSMLTDVFYSSCFLYFGRRFAFRTKNLQVGSRRAKKIDKES
jgi:hypothetical protein